jgi:hypothetical protein
LIHVVFALLGFGMNEITAERLRELLHYDPATGLLTWLVNPSPRVRIGDVAGRVRSDGYRIVRADGQRYLAHRLAWLHVHGEWPPHHIDHINGDPSDNRFANLRPATGSQNQANARKPRTNTSGYMGVRWHTAARKWEARIRLSGRQSSLGCFDCPAEAHAAYMAAAKKYYGEFARAA